ncbi:hypothetical protein R1sor_002053 [Riccia sorocarpa]|uniref:Replitron HUH endonuclease domain-containing protein n=1 Tax=Riccia sorocarpa TaxID=122646 RepID=A0ABD3GZN9_9MARC
MFLRSKSASSRTCASVEKCLEAIRLAFVAMASQQKRMKTLAREHAQTVSRQTSEVQQTTTQIRTRNVAASATTQTRTRNVAASATTKAPAKATTKAPAKPVEPKPRKPRRVAEKLFDVSITISISGTDIKGEAFDKMAIFLENRAEMGVLGLERGDSHLQLHIQGMMRISTSSACALKTEIRDIIGWDDGEPLGASICVKSLKYKGLHTVIGLIGYCLKDEGQGHFRFYSKNASNDQKEEGRRMHAIYGASEYKNRLELNSANVLGRALQFRKYRVKNPTSITFRRCVREMFYSGHYMPAFRWLTNAKISRLRAERIWRVCTTPQSIEMPDVDHILFGIETPARYFEEPRTVKEESEESEPPTEVKEDALPDEDENTPIPVVNLERPEGSGADLERVQEALLHAGFAVGRKTTKEMENSNVLPEYIRLWR